MDQLAAGNHGGDDRHRGAGHATGGGELYHTGGGNVRRHRHRAAGARGGAGLLAAVWPQEDEGDAVVLLCLDLECMRLEREEYWNGLLQARPASDWSIN
eukprot:9499856-Pyramimonas_sp.AAC.1